jgi:hypothetical protein
MQKSKQLNFIINNISFFCFQVLVVFNLADPQSLLGEWIALFVKAAEMKYGKNTYDNLFSLKIQ